MPNEAFWHALEVAELRETIEPLRRAAPTAGDCPHGADHALRGHLR
ncbi:MAG: hypothetical protein ABWU16_04135 [Halothiobacillaceae bacterium]